MKKSYDSSLVSIVRSALTGLLLALAAGSPVKPAFAEPTRELYISDPKEVLEGDPVSTSVDASGHISVGPDIAAFGPAIGRPATAFARSGRDLVVGTAGGGVHVIRAQKSPAAVTELLKVDDKVVTAILAKDGGHLIALAPGGEVVRLGPKKEPASASKPLLTLAAKYIWALAADDGRTMVVTGQPGQVVAIDDQKKQEVLFDSGESHLRALARHPQRGWIVGGGQKGIVYQLEGKGQARALYDSKFEEVTAFAVDRRFGHLYAAFVSANKSGQPLAERWIGPTGGDKPPNKDTALFKGSEVVRIRPTGQVEVLWSSNTEGAMALHYDADARRLYFSTGTASEGRARVYAIDVGDRDRLSLWARLEPAIASVMVPGSKGALLVGTAPTGQVYQVGPTTTAQATYLSVKQDLLRTGRIGRLWFDADIPDGAEVTLSIRSGNTSKPDDTWSKWSTGVSDPDGGAVTVPDARYVQLRAKLKASKRGGPRLKSMHASVVRHNVAPVVKEIFMLRRGVFLASLPGESSKEKTLTLSGRALSSLRKPDKRDQPLRVRQSLRAGAVTIAWRADDPDGDDLLYRVEMRRLDEPRSRWRQLAKNRTEDYWSFDSLAYPDGHYQFRVSANDRPSNRPEDTLVDTLTSAPVLVDNTAPRLTNARARRRKGGRLFVEADVADAHSRIDSAEVSVGGGPWLMLPAADGLLDARKEHLQVELRPDDLPEDRRGPITVRIRVTDEADNEASASATTKK